MADRIQKILAARGVASRRKCEELILQGRVTCNGALCALGDCADPDTDTIFLDGKPIPSKPVHIYIMLHKPRGYVTTLHDEKGRKNAAMLVSDCGQRVYPVGRLDMDSEGLLLLTNDGDFAYSMMHPKHEVDKTYMVTVKGYSDQCLEKLKRPIVLDGYKIRPPQVELVRDLEGGKALLCVTIHEGRNRQVRRMCAAAGMAVQRLVRVAEGALCLGDLPSGKWRYLTDSEIKSIL